MKYYFIENEHAGSSQQDNTWPKIEKYLNKQKVFFKKDITKYPGDAVDLAQTFCQKETKGWVIVAVGGDGTLFEVLNGMKKGNSSLPIGYIPTGSGNDFARALRIPRDVDKATKLLINNKRTTSLDIGYYQDINGDTRYFTNNIGIGFDALVVENSNKRFKKIFQKLHLKSLSYIFSLVFALVKQKAFDLQVDIDGQYYKFPSAYLVSVTNISCFGGGVPIAPQASLKDGKLDIVITPKMSLAKFVKLFIEMIKDGSHLNDKYLFYTKAHRIHIISKKAEYSQINGETQGPKMFNWNVGVASQKFWL